MISSESVQPDIAVAPVTMPTKPFDLFSASSPPPSATSSRIHEGSPHSISEYCGYVPPAGVTVLEERISSAELSPEQFFAQYVSARRPVAISGHLTDQEWAGSKWTNRYLKEQAGRATVLVERRLGGGSSTRGAFGAKGYMSYARFLSELEQGNETLYMTTQDLDRDESDLDDYGMPQAIVGEPARSLRGDFPQRPRLLGHMVPYQLSLWQGASRDGASSGLHHDFHDNLYVLIRGHKRFRLFPPSAAGVLRTTGAVTKVHKNGLIVYEMRDGCRTVSVRADGVPLAFLARRKREEAESDLADAEDELMLLSESSMGAAAGKRAGMTDAACSEEACRLRQVVTDCEDLIDEAIAEAIRYGDASDDEDEVISISDDDDDETAEPAAKQPRLESVDKPNTDGAGEKDKKGDKSETAGMEKQLEKNFCQVKLPADCTHEELDACLLELYKAAALKQQPACGDKQPPAVPGDLCESVDMDIDENGEDTAGADAAAKLSAPVASDSIVLNNDSANHTSAAVDVAKTNGSKHGGASHVQTLPELPPSLGCLVVDLKPGEMLYVPASWFHEVTSRSEDSSTTCENNGKDCSKSQEGSGVVDSEACSREAADVAPFEKVFDAQGTGTDATEHTDESGAAKDIITGQEAAATSLSDPAARPIDPTATGPSDAASLLNDKAASPKDNTTSSATASSSPLSNATAEALELDASKVPSSANSAAATSQPSTASSGTKEASATGVRDRQRRTAANDVGHLAFNYWVYPPDSGDFAAPYVGEFWAHRWHQLQTLRCTLGRDARREGLAVKGNKHDGEDDDSGSSVINLDSDEDDDDSDCYPTGKSNKKQEASPMVKKARAVNASSVEIDDTSSLCEIVDADESGLSDELDESLDTSGGGASGGAGSSQLWDAATWVVTDEAGSEVHPKVIDADDVSCILDDSQAKQSQATVVTVTTGDCGTVEILDTSVELTNPGASSELSGDAATVHIIDASANSVAAGDRLGCETDVDNVLLAADELIDNVLLAAEALAEAGTPLGNASALTTVEVVAPCAAEIVSDIIQATAAKLDVIPTAKEAGAATGGQTVVLPAGNEETNESDLLDDNCDDTDGLEPPDDNILDDENIDSDAATS